MIRGAHHVAISTPDMERALSFYRDLMGFKEVMRGEWPAGIEQVNKVLGLPDSSAKQVMLKGGNLCIELFEFAVPTPTPLKENRPVCDHGHTHLCFDVVDIESEYERLVAGGVKFNTPPQDFGEVKSTYGRDFDGNVFEIQEIVSPDCSFKLLD